MAEEKPKVDHPEYWNPRGIGGGSGAGVCWVSGLAIEGHTADISGFVTSCEAGERVVALFEGRAYLDYRPSEPGWIQVKVAVRPEHNAALERLYTAASRTQGVIDERLLKWAKYPDAHPGYKPKVLDFVDELVLLRLKVLALDPTFDRKAIHAALIESQQSAN